MKRGQVDHLVDVLLGIFILALAFIMTSCVAQKNTTTPVSDLQFKDSFDRMLLVFLQSPVTPIAGTDDLATLSRQLTTNNFTYGDALYLATLQSSQAPVYQRLFSSKFRLTSQTLFFSPSAKTFAWQLNVSSAPSFVVEASQGESDLYTYLVAETSSSNISLYYPLLPPAPLLISWQQGEQQHGYRF